MFNTSIVILEDNNEILYLYTEMLSKLKNATIETFTDPRKGLDFAITNKPDIVITDNAMPYCDGLHVAEKIREVYNPKIILASAFINKTVRNSPASYFDKFVNKPLGIMDLPDIVNSVIDEINKEKIKILNKITGSFLEDINCTGKDRIFIDSVIRTLMYDTDRMPDDSIYALLSKELEKDESTIRRNISKAVDHSYSSEPSLFQRIMGFNKKPKNKEFIDTLLQKINEKAREEKW